MFFRRKANPVELVDYVLNRVLTAEERETIRNANPDRDIEKFIYNTAREVSAKYNRTDSLAIIYEFVQELRSGVSGYRKRILLIDLFYLKLFNCRCFRRRWRLARR